MHGALRGSRLMHEYSRFSLCSALRIEFRLQFVSTPVLNPRTRAVQEAVVLVRVMVGLCALC